VHFARLEADGSKVGLLLAVVELEREQDSNLTGNHKNEQDWHQYPLNKQSFQACPVG
jgi:hypothetical protein